MAFEKGSFEEEGHYKMTLGQYIALQLQKRGITEFKTPEGKAKAKEIWADLVQRAIESYLTVPQSVLDEYYEKFPERKPKDRKQEQKPVENNRGREELSPEEIIKSKISNLEKINEIEEKIMKMKENMLKDIKELEDIVKSLKR